MDSHLRRDLCMYLSLHFMFCSSVNFAPLGTLRPLVFPSLDNVGIKNSVSVTLQAWLVFLKNRFWESVSRATKIAEA